MQDFVQCCSEPFTLFTPNCDTEYCKSADASNYIRMDLDSDQLLLSVTSPRSSVKQLEPMPSASNDPSINLLSVCSVKNMTPRKIKLKKHLHFISTLRSEQKKRHVSSVKSLKGLINRQRINKIKYLNQEINRKTARLAVKEATITKLRQQLKQGKEVQVTSAMMGDSNLKHLQRTHKRLRDSNKIKRKLKYADTVSLDKFASLQLKLTAKDEVITMLENRVLVLEEEIELKEATDKTKVTKKDGKTYSTDMRMSIYDAIVSQVPTQNIPSLIEKLSQRTGEKLSALPHRTTVEQMARELDVIADLKAAELSMKISDLTGF